jgi:hypothetical protein
MTSVKVNVIVRVRVSDEQKHGNNIAFLHIANPDIFVLFHFQSI